MRQGSLQGFGICLIAEVLGDKTVRTVCDDIIKSAYGRADWNAPAGKRLNQRYRHALIVGRKREEVRAEQIVRHVMTLAQEMDATLCLAYHGLHLGSVIAVAYH